MDSKKFKEKNTKVNKSYNKKQSRKYTRLFLYSKKLCTIFYLNYA